jgi:hypothetical protein
VVGCGVLAGGAWVVEGVWLCLCVCVCVGNNDEDDLGVEGRLSLHIGSGCWSKAFVGVGCMFGNVRVWM